MGEVALLARTAVGLLSPTRKVATAAVCDLLGEAAGEAAGEARGDLRGDSDAARLGWAPPPFAMVLLLPWCDLGDRCRIGVAGAAAESLRRILGPGLGM